MATPGPAYPTGGGDLLADGTVPLTATWDVGDFSIVNIAELAVGTDTPADFIHFEADALTAFRIRTSDGHAAFGGAPEGGTRVLITENKTGNLRFRLENTNTATGGCQFNVLVQDTAGDAFFLWTVVGGENYALGIDNSDGDKLRIQNRSALNVADDGITLTGSSDVGVNIAAPLSKFHAGGSFGHKVATVSTTPYTAADETVILVDATGGTRTVDLPAASGVTDRKYYIKKIDASANAVTVDGDASETIDGATTQALASQYDVLEIVCDGSNWHIL